MIGSFKIVFIIIIIIMWVWSVQMFIIMILSKNGILGAPVRSTIIVTNEHIRGQKKKNEDHTSRQMVAASNQLNNRTTKEQPRLR